MTTWLNEHLGFQGMHDPFPEDTCVVEVTDLKDGYNDPELVYLKAKRIVGKLKRGKRVVIFCHAGLSRSPGMVTLVLAYMHKADYEEMSTFVKSIAPQVNTAPTFIKSCEEALRLLNARLTKQCECGTPIENWEKICEYCWFK